MNFIRKLPSKLVQASHFKVTGSNERRITYNPFVKNSESQGQNKWDNVAGLYIPLEQYPRYRKNILKRARDTSESDDDQLNGSNAKRPQFNTPIAKKHEEHYANAKRNPFSENNNRKRRARDYDDELLVESKKPRFNEVQYAIKLGSQYPNPNRKILDNFFDPEITAEGWKKKSDVIEYHTEIRGQYFVDTGSSINDAKENVAARALKELCNLKQERINWPEQLLPFRLNQEFADKIERSVNHFVGIVFCFVLNQRKIIFYRIVKSKFDQIMRRDLRYKAYKVLAGIVMTNGMSFDKAEVVAIATGTKISNINEDEDGIILHDMHAEVLARRSFVRFLCNQLDAMLQRKLPSSN